jgi:hypothetical protein
MPSVDSFFQQTYHCLAEMMPQRCTAPHYTFAKCLCLKFDLRMVQGGSDCTPPPNRVGVSAGGAPKIRLGLRGGGPPLHVSVRETAYRSFRVLNGSFCLALSPGSPIPREALLAARGSGGAP